MADAGLYRDKIQLLIYNKSASCLREQYTHFSGTFPNEAQCIYK